MRPEGELIEYIYSSYDSFLIKRQTLNTWAKKYKKKIQSPLLSIIFYQYQISSKIFSCVMKSYIDEVEKVKNAYLNIVKMTRDYRIYYLVAEFLYLNNFHGGIHNYNDSCIKLCNNRYIKEIEKLCLKAFKLGVDKATYLLTCFYCVIGNQKKYLYYADILKSDHRVLYEVHIEIESYHAHNIILESDIQYIMYKLAYEHYYGGNDKRAFILFKKSLDMGYTEAIMGMLHMTVDSRLELSEVRPLLLKNKQYLFNNYKYWVERHNKDEFKEYIERVLYML